MKFIFWFIIVPIFAVWAWKKLKKWADIPSDAGSQRTDSYSVSGSTGRTTVAPPQPTPVRQTQSVTINASKLNDAQDRQFVLKEEDSRILSSTRESVRKASSCRRSIDLSLDFVDEVNRLVRAAENINGNANVSLVRDGEFKYYSELWYRSVLASSMLAEAEEIIGKKVLGLHKIDFRNTTPEQRKVIIELQRELPKYQSLLSKKKHALWSNNAKLREKIRVSGPRGRRWYEDLMARTAEKKLNGAS